MRAAVRSTPLTIKDDQAALVEVINGYVAANNWLYSKPFRQLRIKIDDLRSLERIDECLKLGKALELGLRSYTAVTDFTLQESSYNPFSSRLEVLAADGFGNRASLIFTGNTGKIRKLQGHVQHVLQLGSSFSAEFVRFLGKEELAMQRMFSPHARSAFPSSDKPVSLFFPSVRSGKSA